MRRRNLTMGEMSQFMAQNDYGSTANFARKKRKRPRSKKGRLNISKTGVLKALGALGAGAGGTYLVGTSKGRSLVGSARQKVARGVYRVMGRKPNTTISNPYRPEMDL